MENKLIDDDNLEISTKTYTKITNSIKKTGYVDGISDGRDSVFQRDFDRGYADGFRNAFVLGKIHGKLASLPDKAKEHGDLPNEMKKPTRGNCQICVNNSLMNEKIDKISDIQNISVEIHKTLNEKYKDV